MHEQIHEQLHLDEQFPFAMFRSSERQQFLHYHDFLELNLVESGTGSYIIDGHRYPVQEGDFFVINNEELHMAICEEKECSRLTLSVIVFDVDLLWRNKGIGQFLTPFFSRKKEFSHRIHNSQFYMAMLETFRKIEEEYNKKQKG